MSSSGGCNIDSIDTNDFSAKNLVNNSNSSSNTDTATHVSTPTDEQLTSEKAAATNESNFEFQNANKKKMLPPSVESTNMVDEMLNDMNFNKPKRRIGTKKDQKKLHQVFVPPAPSSIVSKNEPDVDTVSSNSASMQTPKKQVFITNFLPQTMQNPSETAQFTCSASSIRDLNANQRENENSFDDFFFTSGKGESIALPSSKLLTNNSGADLTSEDFTFQSPAKQKISCFDDDEDDEFLNYLRALKTKSPSNFRSPLNKKSSTNLPNIRSTFSNSGFKSPLLPKNARRASVGDVQVRQAAGLLTGLVMDGGGTSVYVSSPNRLNSRLRTARSSLSPSEKKTKFTPPRPRQISTSKTLSPIHQTPKKSDQHTYELFDLTPREGRVSLYEMTLKSNRMPHVVGHNDLITGYNLTEQILDLDADRARVYNFLVSVGDETSSVGYRELWSALVDGDGVSKSSISLAWVQNHYGWIVWKLASMERAFPHEFANRYLDVDRVYAQLKYRYEREICRCERSALRRVLERDAHVGAPMILLVSSIRYDGVGNAKYVDNNEDRVTKLDKSLNEDECANTAEFQNKSAILELSDGWYRVLCLLDSNLTHLVQKKRIFVGQKLLVTGATICGAEPGPISPLEVTTATMLNVCCNGVRRAVWHSKLGFVYKRYPVISMNSLVVNGGICPMLDLVVLRCYPLNFIETVNDDSKLVMSISGEQNAHRRWSERVQAWYEENVKKFSEEFELDEGRNKEQFELWVKEKIDQKARLSKELEPRKVTSRLKLLVCDYPSSKMDSILALAREHGYGSLFSLLDNEQISCISRTRRGMLTIWGNISEDDHRRFKEGQRVKVSQVIWKSKNNNQLETTNCQCAYLTTTAMSKFNFVNGAETDEATKLTNLTCLFGRCATPLSDLAQHGLWAFDDERIHYIRERAKLVEKFLPIDQFDAIGLVVDASKLEEQVGTNKLSIDASMHRDIPMVSQTNYPFVPPLGSHVCIKNAVYKGFDREAGVYHASYTDSTELITKTPVPATFSSAYQRLQRWRQSTQFQDEMDQVDCRIALLIPPQTRR